MIAAGGGALIVSLDPISTGRFCARFAVQRASRPVSDSHLSRRRAGPVGIHTNFFLRGGAAGSR